MKEIAMKNNSKILISLIASATLAACVQRKPSSQVKMRPLTKQEAHADFSELVERMRNLYGPLQYKEARLGFKLDDLAKKGHDDIDAAKTETETLGVYAKFLAKFRDAHVSIQFPANSTGITAYKIGIFLIPVEGKALVAAVDPDLQDQNIAVGDEVVTIDGVTPFSMLPTILKYRDMANDVSNRQALFKVLNRPAIITELTPKTSTARLEFAKADGSKMAAELHWNKISNFTQSGDTLIRPSQKAAHGLKTSWAAEMNHAAGMNMMESVTPFFLTDGVKSKYNMVRVTPNAEYLKKYTLDATKNPEIYAAMYRYQNKNILLVRQPTYSHEDPETLTNDDYMNGYRAVLDQYEAMSDVLVIDQTHNGGGSYCEDFFALFIKDQARSSVEKLRADRKWIVDLHDGADDASKSGQMELSRSFLDAANMTESAYDSGQFLSAPFALFSNTGTNLTNPDKLYTWKKPMLVLVDELSASCADMFPMLIKSNNVAKIFGERTMGAGGNVEPMLDMPNSRANIHITRGLFTTYIPDGQYKDENFVENNGVIPDIHYSHKVSDVRAGYTGYVDTFSKAALDQIK